MIRIEEISANKLPHVQEIAWEVWPRTYSSILTPTQIEYMMEKMYSEAGLDRQMNEWGHRFLVAYEQEQPLAFASFSPKADGTEGEWKLHKIYVRSDQQGRNLGRMLIRTVCEKARERGARSLSLNVNRNNSARYFYERLGFKVIREEDIDIGQGYFMNDYVLSLELSGETPLV